MFSHKYLISLVYSVLPFSLNAPSGASVTVVKTVKSQRPVNLDITTIKLPLPAYVSITHRISGLAIFFGIAFLIWGLGMSLESEESFNALKECMSGFVPKLIIWAILAGFIYHFVAGVRHLLMDLGYFETLQGAKMMATCVLVVAAALIVLAGIWVW